MALSWTKQVWTKEEDAALIALIEASGGGSEAKWCQVGVAMEGRSAKQCRERWLNHLSPDVSKQKWTAEEDRAIIEAVALYGTRWSELVKAFPGRTDSTIKNRWNAMQRKEKRRVERLHDQAMEAPPGSVDALAPARRRRLVQESDTRPAAALAPVVVASGGEPPPALLQQMAAVAALPPDWNPAVKARPTRPLPTAAVLSLPHL